MNNYIVPILLIALLVYALVKKVKCYDCFVLGAQQALPLSLSLFPYIAAVFLMMYLMRECGFDELLGNFLSPAFELLGIPPELTQLVILRPFSGSGSLALLSQVYQQYGADSYISRAASIIMGSTETVFYVAGVYFANLRVKGITKAILITLLCSFVGCILACWLCKIM